MNNEVSTPRLGIAKGIIVILLGIMWLNTYSLGAMLGYQDNGNFTSYLAGVIWGWVVFGFCLWRGILAVVKRKSKVVTYTNLGIWVFLFVGTLIFVIWTTH